MFFPVILSSLDWLATYLLWIFIRKTSNKFKFGFQYVLSFASIYSWYALGDIPAFAHVKISKSQKLISKYFVYQTHTFPPVFVQMCVTLRSVLSMSCIGSHTVCSRPAKLPIHSQWLKKGRTICSPRIQSFHQLMKIFLLGCQSWPHGWNYVVITYKKSIFWTMGTFLKAFGTAAHFYGGQGLGCFCQEVNIEGLSFSTSLLFYQLSERLILIKWVKRASIEGWVQVFCAGSRWNALPREIVLMQQSSLVFVDHNLVLSSLQPSPGICFSRLVVLLLSEVWSVAWVQSLSMNGTCCEKFQSSASVNC